MTFSLPDIATDLGAEPSLETDGHSIMAKLRLETSEAHTSIERSPAMRAIFSEDYSLKNYRSLLRRLWEFYSPLEREVFGKFPKDLATELEYRRKAHCLAADLCALGDTAPVSEDLALPAFTSPAERAGSLYVTEGATLGGQLIRKRLHDHFGDAIVPALSFYSGYGKQAAKEWRAFGALFGGLFDRAGASVQDHVVAGANATFNAMERWLNDPQWLDAAAGQPAR